jgi:hypothetical protein
MSGVRFRMVTLVLVALGALVCCAESACGGTTAPSSYAE